MSGSCASKSMPVHIDTLKETRHSIWSHPVGEPERLVSMFRLLISTLLLSSQCCPHAPRSRYSGRKQLDSE